MEGADAGVQEDNEMNLAEDDQAEGEAGEEGIHFFKVEGEALEHGGLLFLLFYIIWGRKARRREG